MTVMQSCVCAWCTLVVPGGASTGGAMVAGIDCVASKQWPSKHTQPLADSSNHPA